MCNTKKNDHVLMAMSMLRILFSKFIKYVNRFFLFVFVFVFRKQFLFSTTNQPKIHSKTKNKKKQNYRKRKRSNDDQCKSIRKTYLKLWRIIAKPMPVKNDKIEQIK